MVGRRAEKLFVYKCKSKADLHKFGGSFTVSSWIMMSQALNTQEGLLNNNHSPFISHMTIDTINRKIQEMKNRLLQ